MELILLILLIGVWAAFVVPAVVNSRREAHLNAREPIRPANTPLPSGHPRDHKAQVLARRKAALIVLGALVVLTLVGAVITHSKVLLVLTLASDVALGFYIAMLLTIKQRQPAQYGTRRTDASEDARAVSR